VKPDRRLNHVAGDGARLSRQGSPGPAVQPRDQIITGGLIAR
jgi:hypothetical protein